MAKAKCEYSAVQGGQRAGVLPADAGWKPQLRQLVQANDNACSQQEAFELSVWRELVGSDEE